MIGSLLYTKLLPHLKQSKSVAYLDNGAQDQIFPLTEHKLDLYGLETDGKSRIPTIATTTATRAKQNQQQNTVQQQKTCRYCKKTKPCRKRIRKEHERQGENKLPKDLLHNYTHLAHSAKKPTKQQKCDKIDQMRQTDPKVTKLKTLTNPQPRLVNQNVHSKYTKIHPQEIFK